MYYLKRWFFRKIYKLLRKTPLDMPMVQYWKTSDRVAAKVIKNKEGALVMKMEGEKEIFPGFPRGHLLFGTLSKLKHAIKNQLFNDSWWALDRGESHNQIIRQFVKSFSDGEPITYFDGSSATIKEVLEDSRYDMVPPEQMVKPVREIWRAFTVLEERHPDIADQLSAYKKALTYCLQEDDAMRFRMQWMIQIFNPSAWWFWFDPVKWFGKGLDEVINAEIVGDMKLRVNLLKRILLLILEDQRIRDLFLELCREMNWNKLKLTKADKFHFRGKWFKVYLDKFEY